MKQRPHALMLPMHADPNKVTVIYGICVMCGKRRARYKDRCNPSKYSPVEKGKPA